MVCLIIVSTSGPDLSRFRLSLVRLVTRSAKARFGQVGNQVRKVKDQVGQGQGQELDNIRNQGDGISFEDDPPTHSGTVQNLELLLHLKINSFNFS